MFVGGPPPHAWLVGCSRTSHAFAAGAPTHAARRESIPGRRSGERPSRFASRQLLHAQSQVLRYIVPKQHSVDHAPLCQWWRLRLVDPGGRLRHAGPASVSPYCNAAFYCSTRGHPVLDLRCPLLSLVPHSSTVLRRVRVRSYRHEHNVTECAGSLRANHCAPPRCHVLARSSH